MTSVSQIDTTTVMVAAPVAADPKRDLALLQLVGGAFDADRIARWSGGESVRVAADVFAIGHPEGHLWTFTYGVVSALPSPYEWSYDGTTMMSANCILTQTPINPGNSGGALFDDGAGVIGINSMSASGEGLHFAVRVDEVKDFLRGARQGRYPLPEAEEVEIEWTPIENHGVEGVETVWGTDSSGDGQFDIWLLGSEENPIGMYFDSDYDGVIDLYWDAEENTWYQDSDGDGSADKVGVDEDGDGLPDRFQEA